MTTSCPQVRKYIQQVLRTPVAAPLDAALVAHIAECSTCQGALLLMQASLLDAPVAASITCAACQHLLPGYIDEEASDGTAAALRSYPQVGAHLWSCPECAEIYLMTLAFMAAERSGELGSLPVLPQMPRLLPTICLRRAFLNAALPAPLAQRIAIRGDDAEDQMLYAEQHDQYHVRLSVRRQHDDHCIVIVATSPVTRGWLRLRLGSHIAKVQFDQAGQAQVAGLPPILLDAPDGPDLLLEIELAAE